MRKRWGACGIGGFVAMSVLVMTACSISVNSVRGSGTVTTEVRQVSGFSQVKLSGIGSLAIVQTGTEGLTVSAEDNIVPLILTDVTGSVLNIHLKSDVSLQPTKPIVYLLSVKDLSTIMLSGAGTVSLQHLTTNALEVDQSGAGSITLSGLQLSTFTAKLSGAGSLTASGTTNSQTVTSSGTVSYQADQLQSTTAQVTLSGVGNAVVRVSQSLDITISGVGSLTYYGSPAVTQHISGLGKVTHAQG